jgi:hypothetical protein
MFMKYFMFSFSIFCQKKGQFSINNEMLMNWVYDGVPNNLTDYIVLRLFQNKVTDKFNV